MLTLAGVAPLGHCSQLLSLDFLTKTRICKEWNMFGYKVPAPDEAMPISGGRAAGNAPFRVVTGHGAFIMPFFRKVRFRTLAMCEAEVEEGASLSRESL